MPATVIERLNQFFVEHNVQPYGSFSPSRVAGERIDESYEAISELINADVNEVTVGPSTTLNFYILAQGLRHLLNSGDEIIVTNQDHEANVGVWRRLSEYGVVIREWQIQKETGELEISDFKGLISDRTKLVCCTMCSNVIGTHNDVGTVAELAHKVGALVVADGVSYAPHIIPDVRKLGVDFYGYSTYKTFGTHQGVLWGSSDALQQVRAQGHFFNETEPRYRLNPTGPQHAQIAALAGITEYFDVLYQHHFGVLSERRHDRARKVFALVAEHEAVLANKLLDYLKERSDVRLLGQDYAKPGRRASTIAFHAGISSAKIERRLAKRGIGVGSGNFYARRCIEALGLDAEDGVVRVSLVHYNTEKDIDTLLNALDEVL
jgi:cysteine desulfurase family protein (TIGR01976 family)